MFRKTDDLRIEKLNPLLPPAILMEEYPISDAASETVALARRQATACLRGEDDRLVVVVGPCSIHDAAAAEEYAQRLHAEAQRLSDDLLIVMRVYFEKPRTSVGWKGLINDPDMDGSFHINKGLRTARQLLVHLADMGLPAGCEFLDTIMPQFIADLVSWGAIGARTTESQVHRELASGLSCPIGFKNGTGGSVQIAVDAIEAATHPHHFLSVTKQGVAAIVSTKGNDSCHVILRGGRDATNYDAASVTAASELLAGNGMHTRLMVDCSHANTQKHPERQPEIARDVAAQVATGHSPIFGVMIESHLVGGNQAVLPGRQLVYGQSVTDACLAWEDTLPILEDLARAVVAQRKLP